MATNARTTENGIELVPDDATLLGVDAADAHHYLANPITSDGLVVHVVADDVETIDLLETPCAQCDDSVEGWITHVGDKRGWEHIAYGRREELLTLEGHDD